MLSDLILEHNGKARGKIKGLLDVSIIITYWNMPTSGNDKGAATTTSTYYYGEGKGIISIIGDSNEAAAATVTEYGVGKSLGQRVVWRGSAFYRTTTSSTNLSFLNNLVGVFE